GVAPVNSPPRRPLPLVQDPGNTSPGAGLPQCAQGERAVTPSRLAGGGYQGAVSRERSSAAWACRSAAACCSRVLPGARASSSLVATAVRGSTASSAAARSATAP